MSNIKDILTLINQERETLEGSFHPQENPETLRKAYRDRLTVERIMSKHNTPYPEPATLEAILPSLDVVIFKRLQKLEKARKALADY